MEVARCVTHAHGNSRALPTCDGEDAAATPTPTARRKRDHTQKKRLGDAVAEAFVNSLPEDYWLIIGFA